MPSTTKPPEQLLDEAITAMEALQAACTPADDELQSAIVPAAAFRQFVDKHAELLFERNSRRNLPSYEELSAAAKENQENAQEGLELLDSLMQNIREDGNYSAETTIGFLGQIRQCFAPKNEPF